MYGSASLVKPASAVGAGAGAGAEDGGQRFRAGEEGRGEERGGRGTERKGARAAGGRARGWVGPEVGGQRPGGPEGGREGWGRQGVHREGGGHSTYTHTPPSAAVPHRTGAHGTHAGYPFCSPHPPRTAGPPRQPSRLCMCTIAPIKKRPTMVAPHCPMFMCSVFHTHVPPSQPHWRPPCSLTAPIPQINES